MSTPSREIRHTTWDDSSRDARSIVMRFLGADDLAILSSVDRRTAEEVDAEQKRPGRAAERSLSKANRELTAALRANSYGDTLYALERALESETKVSEVIFAHGYNVMTRLNPHCIRKLGELGPNVRVLKLGDLDESFTNSLNDPSRSLRTLTNVTHLKVGHNGIKVLDAVLKASSETLEVLEVRSASAIDVSLLQKCRRLRSLSVDVHPFFTRSALSRILQQCPNIRSLRICSGCTSSAFRIFEITPCGLEVVTLFDLAYDEDDRNPQINQGRESSLATFLAACAPSIRRVNFPDGRELKGGALQEWLKLYRR